MTRLLLAALLGAVAGVWAYQWWLDDDLGDIERALGRGRWEARPGVSRFGVPEVRTWERADA